MIFIAETFFHGSSNTRLWSECKAIDWDPGLAILAVKLEMMKPSPRTVRTISSAVGLSNMRNQQSLSGRNPKVLLIVKCGEITVV
jgi:hypothetical protein